MGSNNVPGGPLLPYCNVSADVLGFDGPIARTGKLAYSTHTHWRCQAVRTRRGGISHFDHIGKTRYTVSRAVIKTQVSSVTTPASRR
jgi:hypothetical protein